jgi:large subunit ribosomal protein L38
MDEFKRDWEKHARSDEIKSIAEHYNIFKDLYGTGYFYSTADFPISYTADDKLTNVKYGNKIGATQVLALRFTK